MRRLGTKVDEPKAQDCAHCFHCVGLGYDTDRHPPLRTVTVYQCCACRGKENQYRGVPNPAIPEHKGQRAECKWHEPSRYQPVWKTAAWADSAAYEYAVNTGRTR